ncbi:hypothetical protein Tco_1175956 [Tanacetum coccineum]|uniref:Uncharacterized protein n=1 Tax=Tanacetum coccineum TaxID=301880 RepID=A0ABQ5GLW8_9ASTR
MIRDRGIMFVNTRRDLIAERILAYGESISALGNGAQAGVVSFSCLLDLGFKHTVASNGISVSLNGVFYFSAISVNGVFEIDMNKIVTMNSNLSLASIRREVRTWILLIFGM